MSHFSWTHQVPYSQQHRQVLCQRLEYFLEWMGARSLAARKSPPRLNRVAYHQGHYLLRSNLQSPASDRIPSLSRPDHSFHPV